MRPPGNRICHPEARIDRRQNDRLLPIIVRLPQPLEAPGGDVDVGVEVDPLAWMTERSRVSSEMSYRRRKVRSLTIRAELMRLQRGLSWNRPLPSR
jgi:hypothetical protein